MSLFRMSRTQRSLAYCAPITEKPSIDRATRVAIARARRSKRRAGEFERQEKFDRALAHLVQAIPIGADVAEWFANESLIPVKKRTWRTIAFNPAVLAIVLAVGVIAGVFGYRVHEHMHDFPGAPAARKLLAVASSSRPVLIDPVKTDAGSLSDLFFMKHRLEHYDVPVEFADFRTLGCRVFDDEEVKRVAQVFVVEKKMQFFIFPAVKNPRNEAIEDFSDWRFVEEEGWTGAVQQHNGICFMVAVRGTEADLRPYLVKPAP